MEGFFSLCAPGMTGVTAKLCQLTNCSVANGYHHTAQWNVRVSDMSCMVLLKIALLLGVT